ncbi:hypothetical protein [Vibrio fluvialis]|uniref:hypothetical protein n=1 Tax=Vibrio fluvialis TaxID=676 RepID=UPI0023A9D218|nr:hypothetical protein [Vibrio fluvialis]MDE5179059.1 hypothetical protein [Vibrio fluvialis]
MVTSIDQEALTAALTAGVLDYLFSTYWLTVSSVLWQTWGSIALSSAAMDRLRVPVDGLWSMPRARGPLQLHWFPFWTQVKLRNFVFLSGLLYILISHFGSGVGRDIVSLLAVGLLLSLIYQGIMVATSEAAHWSRVVYTLIRGAALIAIVGLTIE